MSGWTPAELPGAVWFDASDPSTFTATEDGRVVKAGIWSADPAHAPILAEAMEWIERPARPWYRRLSLVHPRRKWRSGRAYRLPTDTERAAVEEYATEKWGPRITFQWDDRSDR